jgi:plastocyanin
MRVRFPAVNKMMFLVILLSSVVLVGCPAQPTPVPPGEPTPAPLIPLPPDDNDVLTIEVIARPYEFDPNRIEVQAGRPVEFIVSSEQQYHTFTVKESVEATENIIDIEVFPDNEPVSIQHTFDEPGEYYLYCIPHEGLGMTGTIVVE